MNHTPTPYIVKKSHAAPEIIAVNFKPTPTSKALTRRIAVVLLEGGSEGMEEALENAAFIVEACNAHEGLLEVAKTALDDEWDSLNAGRIRKALALCEGKEKA